MLARGDRAPNSPRRVRALADGRWRPFAWALAAVVLASTGADSGPAAHALTRGPAQAEPDGDGTSFRAPLDRMPATVGEPLEAWPDGPWSTLTDSLPELAPAPQPLGARFGFASAVSGVPLQALTAYRAAGDTLSVEDPSCGLDWSLLAGIGRVESNHGRYGGAVLGDDGVSRPAIIGIALDGRPGVARILDTDGGRLDGDGVFDRAVGPMQFIPGTWAARAADGDGDGAADPHDIADAALSAARYLCAGDADLSTEPGARAALMRYNRSVEYGTSVLAHAGAYRDGTGTDVLSSPFGRLGAATAGPFVSTAWPPGSGRQTLAPGGPLPGLPSAPAAEPVGAAMVIPAAHAGSQPLDGGVPAAPGGPFAAPSGAPAPVLGPLVPPTAPPTRPSPTWTASPTPPSVQPSPSPTEPSKATPAPATDPTPSVSPTAPLVKPSPTPTKSPTAPSVKPSPTDTRSPSAPTVKPSPSTSPSPKPKPSPTTTTPSAPAVKPSPTATKAPAAPSAKPSPTTTPTSPSVKPSPTPTRAPAPARPTPSQPAPVTPPTTAPTPPRAPAPAKPKPAAAAPVPKPAPAPTPRPAPATPPAAAPAPPPAPAAAKPDPPVAAPAPARPSAAPQPTVPAAPPAAAPGLTAGPPAPGADGNGNGRADAPGLERAAEVQESASPGDHARGGGR